MNYNFKWGTHKQVLYDYLSTGKKITTKDAMIDLGIGDLQGTIRDYVKIYKCSNKVWKKRYCKRI